MPRRLWDISGWERISDEEAAALYELWQQSPVGGKLSCNGAKRETISGLKTKGYVCGAGDFIELTHLGKRLIREMATHAPNSFDKNATTPSYSKIKEKRASRPRQTHVSKVASREEKKPFNLRKESLRRMYEE